MSGTLIIQNLEGPSSGANANKIIVPSGNTLDASSGFTPPAGHIIAVSHQKGTDTFTSSGSSWVNSGVSFNYTPLVSTSLIVCATQVAVWRSSYSAYFGVRVVNSGGNTTTPATWGDGYFTGGGAISWDTTYSFSYTANTTSQVTHTFQVHPNGGGTWFPNNAPTFGTDSRWVATIWEVAQ